MVTQKVNLSRKSIEYRKTILKIIKQANAGHTGGSLSCVDILNVLYHRILRVAPAQMDDIGRDRYIHSKGHSVEALYTVLADCGFFDPAELNTLCAYQSPYIGHPTRKVHGIEHNTGGLGHGLPFAVGTALAGKLDRRAYRVFVLVGDGELAEGSNWEACMAAAHFGLDNLVVIVDRNRLQISGKTEDVMALEPLAEKFSSFGMVVRQVDGHDLAALEALLKEVPFEPEKPSLVIASTIKGKGISFIEDRPEWHHHVPTDVELAQALAELENES